MTTQLTYAVPAMHCGSCKLSITEELEEVAGVEAIDVDLGTKRVTVRGDDLDDATLRAAIGEAGYEAM